MGQEKFWPGRRRRRRTKETRAMKLAMFHVPRSLSLVPWFTYKERKGGEEKKIKKKKMYYPSLMKIYTVPLF